MVKSTVVVVASSEVTTRIGEVVLRLDGVEFIRALTEKALAEALRLSSVAGILVEYRSDYVALVTATVSLTSSRPIPVLLLGSGAQGGEEMWELEDYPFVDFLPVSFKDFVLTSKIQQFLYFRRLQEKLAEQEAAIEDKSLEIEVLQQELEEKSDEIMQLSSLDGLTGLFNRYYFDDNLLKEWRQAVRQHDSISLLLIDVDYLKEYNVRYGREAGDDCLQELAGALHQALLRPVDIVARYGGDQFAVILPATEGAGAVLVAKRMLGRVAALELPHAGSCCADVVTISIGVATAAPTKKDKIGDFLHRADGALSAAKTSGRNCLRT